MKYRRLNPSALVRVPVRHSGLSLGETPPTQDSALVRAVPYVVAAVGLFWLFSKTAKEISPPRPSR